MALRDSVDLRAATAEDVPSIATIWHRGWLDGHLGNVPDELTEARTEQSFRTRAPLRIADTTVAVIDDEVAGFVMVVGNEVEQVYVAAGHRGSGVAGALLTEAEKRVREGGYDTAWLAVVPGNERARHFYRKYGWVDEGPFHYQAAGPHGPIRVPAHRYVKTI